MTDAPIKFDDGAAYERMMGVWSRKAGAAFIDWLAAPKGLRWVDIGCGNGAFTDLLIERCAPSQVKGIDPSAGQIEFARSRPGAKMAEFTQGDAMALPYGDGSFDVATMALVLFFVPDPAKGTAEMKRVLRKGGLAAAYVWDLPGGGFPLHFLQEEMRASGLPVPLPPSAAVSNANALRKCWTEAGFQKIEQRRIDVERSFADFDEYWTIGLTSPALGGSLRALSAKALEQLKDKVRARFANAGKKPFVATAYANAVKGVTPA
jgi:ubiquinone/menaquinone biosynthesis C-methylase UbiE